MHASECIALIHHFLRQVLELIGRRAATLKLRMIGFAEHECQGRPEALLARQEHRNDRCVRPAGERHGADMRMGNIPLAHARPLREDEELVPLAQHAERRFHGMDIVGLAVDRESAELCNEPAEHAVRKQLFFCHRAENALLMRADDHPDRVGK